MLACSFYYSFSLCYWLCVNIKLLCVKFMMQQPVVVKEKFSVKLFDWCVFAVCAVWLCVGLFTVDCHTNSVNPSIIHLYTRRRTKNSWWLIIAVNWKVMIKQYKLLIHIYSFILKWLKAFKLINKNSWKKYLKGKFNYFWHLVVIENVWGRGCGLEAVLYTVIIAYIFYVKLHCICHVSSNKCKRLSGVKCSC